VNVGFKKWARCSGDAQRIGVVRDALLDAVTFSVSVAEHHALDSLSIRAWHLGGP
jgi:hypothetical protein